MDPLRSDVGVSGGESYRVRWIVTMELKVHIQVINTAPK